ncbi:MAG: leucyl aminopeptidase [Nitriliruptoraceae bacterium]|nr:leucyl aminopeptidase [Nitriliruptoraceae bacterium]
MPTVEVVATPLAEATTDLVVVAAFAPASGERTDPPEPTAGAIELGDAAGIELAAELAAAGFDASVGATLRVPTRGALPAPAILVIGMGAAEDADTDTLRRAGAAAANAAERLERLAIGLGDALPEVASADAAQAVAEGVHLGSYRFGSYRSEAPTFTLRDVSLHVADDEVEAASAAVEVAAITAGAALLTRELVNIPPQDKRPPALAERAVAEVEGLPVTARVLAEDELEAGGYGGILGVGQGSSEPPRLVELTYAPDGAARHIALVGKGITFDTGGISLKPSASMETMKTDMAGAATVLATIKAAAQLELPVKITALLALAENMPSGTATRVSDVLTMKGGTTVEVINTDAEGRLVMGDALVHASELEPDAIVDVATLTGAMVVALGDRISGLMGSDDELAAAIVAAGDVAGEPIWQLPLATAQYGERVEGAIADLKNAGGREAGSIFAALFLARFVGEDIPWAHLDIAGTAWAASAEGYRGVGGTGTPVRALIEWLRHA